MSSSLDWKRANRLSDSWTRLYTNCTPKTQGITLTTWWKATTSDVRWTTTLVSMPRMDGIQSPESEHPNFRDYILRCSLWIDCHWEHHSDWKHFNICSLSEWVSVAAYLQSVDVLQHHLFDFCSSAFLLEAVLFLVESPYRRCGSDVTTRQRQRH